MSVATYKRKQKLAQGAVKRAVAKGVLIPPTECSRCNTPCKPRAHHPDYDKPLEVIWLCASCHNDVHGNDSVFIKTAAEKAMNIIKPLPRLLFYNGGVNKERTKLTGVKSPLPCSTILQKSQITDEDIFLGDTHAFSRGVAIRMRVVA